MKCGVVLMRAQPMHLGHLDVIKKASAENDRVLVFIGSANKCRTKRNPLNISDRLNIVRRVVEKEHLKNVIVEPLNDWSKEDAFAFAKEWGNFFYYNAVNILENKTFALYYNDNVEIAKNWFEPKLRERIVIIHSEKERDVSSTKIREAILNGDSRYLKTVLPDLVYENRMNIKKQIENANQEDFIM